MTNRLGNIHVLDPLTASQIAAGEVVERPMSVVKELVENSIDAGAKRITVKISGGGCERIQIIDDGCGMAPADMERAFLRHATSKIRSADDIIGVATLGFRGEAMPSIASVSKVTLKSRPQGNDSGYEVQATGETVTPIGECGMPQGTVVTVEDLFYNTPVRKKFLRKPGAESGLVGDLIARLILARPDIAFVFQEEGRTTLHSPGTGDLQQSILAVYDRSVLSNMVPVAANALLTGMISRPGIHRANRSYYNFFINGRWVRCKELTQVVDTAYATLNPKGRYAIVALYLQVPPEAVDVNVHPAKLEVRFRDWPALRQQVLDCLSETLLGKKEPAKPQSVAYPLPQSNEPEPGGLKERAASLLPKQGLERALYQQPSVVVPQKEQPLLPFVKSAREQQPASVAASTDAAPTPPTLARDIAAVSTQADPVASEVVASTQPSSSVTEVSAIPAQPMDPQPQRPGFPWLSLQILGQLKGMYILAEGEDGLYIIDQHAAHERLRYESYKQRFGAKLQQVTQLTLPVALELSHKQKKTLVSQIEALTGMGFLVEYFGEQDFLLRGVPAWYGEGNAEELLLAILDTIGEEESFDLTAFCDDTLFSLACHSAVRANDHLNVGDISWLLSQLEQAQCPFTCPHGRPIAIRLGFGELSRRFDRS